MFSEGQRKMTSAKLKAKLERNRKAVSDAKIMAQAYCVNHGLRFLPDLEGLIYTDCICFALEGEFHGDGMYGDIASLPKHLLYVDRETGEVTETEHTRKYLNEV